MEILKIPAKEVIAKRKDTVREWYLIQEGTVIQKFDFAEVTLGKNAIIGILASDYFPCDYIAQTDVTLAVFSCSNYEDLKRILGNQEKLRSIFLKTALEQRHQMLCLYADLQLKTRQFHAFVESVYNEYKNTCGQLRLEEQAFNRMEHFEPLAMKHKAENWEINNSISLVKNYMLEYIRLMEKDDSLCIGAIMEASAQMRRVTQGIGEMETYLLYNKDILLAESENDIFHLFFDLAMRAGANQCDVEPIKKAINLMIEFITKMKFYDEKLLEYRVSEYKNYDFDGTGLSEFTTLGFDEAGQQDYVEETREAVDYLAHILTYAGMNENEIEVVRKKIEAFRELPDMFSTENDAYQIRRQLIPIFYDVYLKIFMRIVKEGDEPTPIVKMFLNFGFMDAQLAGDENVNTLYDLTNHLERCNSDRVYTIFTWLKAVYNGEKEPSKNEFDLDYPAYIADQRKSGAVKPSEVADLLKNQDEKVNFEIKNMFTSGNRITYGKITTFCPILGEYDLINSIDKMLVTTEKIEEALNEIRKVDFSVFFREDIFSDPAKDINRETIMKEILPDVILMPNAGTKAMMWQETAGVKRATPGRFLFPIFTAADINEMMVETVGRFRWEICRKEQGVHWNDIREKSLTSEYCDYIQFYRKNHELSPDAKEKIKSQLTRARNNYREVFVKDYVNLMKYESKGSFRLNRISRDILVRYCPFTKDVRAELKSNPMYTSSMSRYEIENAKKMQRIVGVYEKYKKAGGVITQELRDNLLFYQM
ncbi:MAG: cyclic nucleotide-binding domain-containing protein [Roseburia sp.]|nr:cyclic nucleotide-binding domain-containing protein [Roseburia sp.]